MVSTYIGIYVILVFNLNLNNQRPVFNKSTVIFPTLMIYLQSAALNMEESVATGTNIAFIMQ